MFKVATDNFTPFQLFLQWGITKIHMTTFLFFTLLLFKYFIFPSHAWLTCSTGLFESISADDCWFHVMPVAYLNQAFVCRLCTLWADQTMRMCESFHKGQCGLSERTQAPQAVWNKYLRGHTFKACGGGGGGGVEAAATLSCAVSLHAYITERPPPPARDISAPFVFDWVVRGLFGELIFFLSKWQLLWNVAVERERGRERQVLRDIKVWH